MWVTVLLEYLTGGFPRPVLIRPDEGGFRQTPNMFTGNTWLKELKPGKWYWIVPWFIEHEVISTKTQCKDVRAQGAWTSDGKNVTVGTSVRYYVTDPMKALLDVHDYDDSLQNIVLTVVCGYVGQHSLTELKGGTKELMELLLKQVREESRGWGLKIQSIGKTDIGDSRNIRLLHSGSSDY